MSKVIASRLKNVLPSIIHHNQTGFIKDRYIGETVRSIFDIMEFTLKENIPGLMIFLDFQKAFDSVEWDFISECLESLNLVLNLLVGLRPFIKISKAVLLTTVLFQTSSLKNVELGKVTPYRHIFLFWQLKL